MKWLFSGMLGWPKSAALSFPLRGLQNNQDSKAVLIVLGSFFMAVAGFVLWVLALEVL